MEKQSGRTKAAPKSHPNEQKDALFTVADQTETPSAPLVFPKLPEKPPIDAMTKEEPPRSEVDKTMENKRIMRTDFLGFMAMLSFISLAVSIVTYAAAIGQRYSNVDTVAAVATSGSLITIFYAIIFFCTQKRTRVFVSLVLLHIIMGLFFAFMGVHVDWTLPLVFLISNTAVYLLLFAMSLCFWHPIACGILAASVSTVSLGLWFAADGRNNPSAFGLLPILIFFDICLMIYTETALDGYVLAILMSAKGTNTDDGKNIIWEIVAAYHKSFISWMCVCVDEDEERRKAQVKKKHVAVPYGNV